MITWDELVEDYFDRLDGSGVDESKRGSLERLIRAATAVSLAAYQGDSPGLRGTIGSLGRLLYTVAVTVPYTLYKAGWLYPVQISDTLGLDLRPYWPDEPIAPEINDWLANWPFSQDFATVADAWDLIDSGDIDSGEQLLEDWLPMALQDAISQLENAINDLSDSVQEEVVDIVDKLNRVAFAIDPMDSQFVDASDPANPVFPIKRSPGSGLTVIPDPSQADVAVNLEELTVNANLFDLVAVGIHLISAYLGADRLPRPYFPAVSDSSTNTDWQINNIADLIGQLHSELREVALVDTEVRQGVEDGNQAERIQTNLGTALGLSLSALRELSLDSERILALSTQAAQAALTATAQLGSKTESNSVDLGYRGQVSVPVSTGASLAQQLNAIEGMLGAIALQLGVSLRPPGG